MLQRNIGAKCGFDSVISVDEGLYPNNLEQGNGGFSILWCGFQAVPRGHGGITVNLKRPRML